MKSLLTYMKPLLTLSAGSLLLAACALTPTYEQPDAPMAGSWAEATGSVGMVEQSRSASGAVERRRGARAIPYPARRPYTRRGWASFRQPSAAAGRYDDDGQFPGSGELSDRSGRDCFRAGSVRSRAQPDRSPVADLSGDGRECA